MSQIRRVRTIAVLSLVGLLGSAGLVEAAEGAVKLRIDLKPATSHRFAMTQNQQMEMQLGAMGNQKTDSQTRIEFSYNVTGVAADGTVTFEAVFDRIVVEIDVAGNKMKFDSNDPPGGESGNPMAALQRTLVGKTISLQMSSRGEILAVGGFDEIFDEMAGDAGNDPGTQQLMELMKQGFGPEAMRGMMQQGLPIFPDKPVKTGESWTHQAKLGNPMLGDMQVRSEYEVQAFEARRGRDCVRLGVVNQMKIEGQGMLVEQLSQLFRQLSQGKDPELDWKIGDTESKGTLWIDRETGLTVDSELDQDVQMEISFNMGQGQEGQPATPMNIKMDIAQQVQVELLD